MTAPLSLFVTGTDTEIGKTLVSCALLRGFTRAGLRAAAMKPVAAGAFERDGQWHNEDAEQLDAAARSRIAPGASERDGQWHNEDADQLDAAASAPLPPGIRTPYLLKEPAAP